MSHYYSNDPSLPHQKQLVKYSTPQGELSFVTDAGVFSRQRVDFGSRVLLSALPLLKGKVLDLGCGYGPIGISLAALNPKAHVTMVDINQRAVSLAQQNIHSNGILNAQARLSDGFSNVEDLFSTIVSNPPIRAGKNIIYPLFEQSIDYLEPGGSLYLVIQKKQGAASAVAKIKEVYGSCTVIDKSGGYWVLKGTKE